MKLHYRYLQSSHRTFIDQILELYSCFAQSSNSISEYINNPEFIIIFVNDWIPTATIQAKRFAPDHSVQVRARGVTDEILTVGTAT